MRILYACESGSRAWEFASPNSDYDVRFLYVRPQKDYLRLDALQDVIERPIVDDLDINGWDIMKVLRLLRNSNPPLLEWLFSPIVYLENSRYIEELRTLARRSYSSVALFYHYSRMAYRSYHQYIEGKSTASLKKYFYVLRPIVALLFLEQHQTLPATSFVRTLAEVELPAEVREHIQQLLQARQASEEIGTGPVDPVLNSFIDVQLAKWNRASFVQPQEKSGFGELNTLLLHILNEDAVVPQEV
ncbi:hypothetical protein KDI_12820 [Dictyobacter arantiisoli]|uniref:Nucleotidyltransferase n=1 Tax=Dictyobacter arantiisoli TaxID=2014874 RepID=A0A5A5T8I9_9CHLR|nr:hypothetical protein KDI_12820 [Dictyobacter arantiisoli]